MVWNRILYLIITVIMGVFSILYNEYITTIIFIITLLLPVLSLILLIFIYKKIEVQIIIDKGRIVSRNERIPVLIKVRNESLFPISRIKLRISYGNLFVKGREHEVISIPVDGESVQTISCSLLSEHCGKIIICVDYLKCYDYFKLFSLKKSNTVNSLLFVIPEICEIVDRTVVDNPRMSVDVDIYSKVKSGDDPSEVFDIREYREGDRLQRIHWKLSNKRDAYMIKDFSLPINSRILTMIDFSIGKTGRNIMDYIDEILITGMSMVYHFNINGQINYITWYNNDNEECTRYKVNDEEDIITAVQDIYNMNIYNISYDLIKIHNCQFENEEYTLINYICMNISKDHLKSISSLEKYSNINIFVLKRENDRVDEELIELVNIYENISINILDMNNLKEEIKYVTFY